MRYELSIPRASSEKPEGEMSLGKLRLRREYNIKAYLDSNDSECRLMAGTWECDNSLH